jgi:hypothetical protein
MTLDRWASSTGRLKAISDQLCGIYFGLLTAVATCPFHMLHRQVNKRSERLLLRPMDMGLARSTEEIAIVAVKSGLDTYAITHLDTPCICPLR